MNLFSETECPLCYGPCDPEIHEATVRIHQYLRAKVKEAMKPKK